MHRCSTKNDAAESCRVSGTAQGLTVLVMHLLGPANARARVDQTVWAENCTYHESLRLFFASLRYVASERGDRCLLGDRTETARAHALVAMHLARKMLINLVVKIAIRFAAIAIPAKSLSKAGGTISSRRPLHPQTLHNGTFKRHGLLDGARQCLLRLRA